MTDLADNPLLDGFLLERVPDPCTVVIFGATGDLTMRKLVPALFDQSVERRLPQGFTVVGSGRKAVGTERFRQDMLRSVSEHARHRPPEPGLWESFAQGLHYVGANTDDPEAFAPFAQELRRLAEPRNGGHNWLFYMATPPSATLNILRGLWASGLAAGRPASPTEGARSDVGWTRVVLEKPFGTSLEDARNLNAAVLQLFYEDQLFRIDHYLGKEAVQNILVFRFANRIFEPVWSNREVDHVQITVAESLGVENRAGYYEGSGALKDMLQNHLLQLLALVAMEAPARYSAEAVRDEKAKVLEALRPIRPDEVPRIAVRAQYDSGWIGGRPVPGYREEAGVDPASRTETYAAFRMHVDNWRWSGVPFYLRSGKRLPKRVSEISVHFRAVPHQVFEGTLSDQRDPNMLVFRIQPDEGISLRFSSKLPGGAVRIRSLNMDFHYGTSFGTTGPEAYERLLLDCMLGDSTLFARRDAVESSWEAVTPILEHWQSEPPKRLPGYEAGTWGPAEADRMLERDGRRWRQL